MNDAEKPSDPTGPTGRLVSWVHGLAWDDVPPTVIARATHLLLDGIGCALVGAQLPWSRTATEAVLALEGAGDSVVIGTGRKTSAPAATLLNSSFIQGFELDDFHPTAPLHSAAVLVPALLATADQIRFRTGREVTGRELLLAAIVGFEVGPRIGRALHGSQMLSRGWHSGAVFGGPAAALASGKLRASAPAILEDALGFAATQAAGLMSAQYEAMGKRMQHGFAARNGFYAAGLAEAGYTGIDQVLEREYGGFLAVYGEGHAPDAEAVTAGLGRSWETAAIVMKSFAVMGGLHGAVEAARELRAEIDVAEIESIHLRVGDVVYHHGWWQPVRPLETIGAQMNIGYATAVTLLDGGAGPLQFAPARLDADDVWHLIDRTQVHHDPAIDALPPTERFQTHLTVTLRDGSVRSRSVIAPHGNPLDPVTNEEAVEKYRYLSGLVVDRERSRAIEQRVLGLADLSDLRELLELLGPTVRGALR